MSLGSRLFRFRGNVPYVMANMNESYLADLSVFNHETRKKAKGPKSQRVLCISSSGETAFALCSNPSAQTVIGSDINFSQVHYSELRRQALVYLDTSEFKILNGVADSDYERESQTRERISLFQKVAGKLPQSSQDFWSALRDSAVAFGLMYTGKADVMNSKIREGLLEKGYDFPLQRFHEYAKEDSFWREISKPLEPHNFFSSMNADLFLPSEAYEAGLKMYDPNIFLNGLKNMHRLKVDVEKNYFTTLLFNGTHALTAGDKGLPLIFTEKGRDALLSNGIGPDRLVFTAKSVFDVAAEEKGLNFVTLSNVFDMFPASMIQKVLKIVHKSMASDGLLVVRKGNPNSPIRPDLEASGFEIDGELTQIARENEESVFLGKYGNGETILVARKKEILDKE